MVSEIDEGQSATFTASGFDPDDHDGIILKKTTLPDGTLSD